MWSQYARLDQGGAVQEAWKHVIADMAALEDPRSLRPPRDGGEQNKWLQGTQKWEVALDHSNTILAHGFSPTAAALAAICILRINGFTAFVKNVTAVGEFFRKGAAELQGPNIPGDSLGSLSHLGSPHLVMSLFHQRPISDEQGTILAQVNVEGSEILNFREKGEPFSLETRGADGDSLNALMTQLRMLEASLSDIELGASVSLKNIRIMVQSCRSQIDEAGPVPTAVNPVDDKPAAKAADEARSTPRQTNTIAQRLARMPCSCLLQPYREAAVDLLTHRSVTQVFRLYQILPPELESFGEAIDLPYLAGMHWRDTDEMIQYPDTIDMNCPLEHVVEILAESDAEIFSKIYVQRLVELAKLNMPARTKEIARDRSAWRALVAPVFCTVDDLVRRVEMVKSLCADMENWGAHLETFVRKAQAMSGKPSANGYRPSVERRPSVSLSSAPHPITPALLTRELSEICDLYQVVKGDSKLDSLFESLLENRAAA